MLPNRLQDFNSYHWTKQFLIHMQLKKKSWGKPDCQNYSMGISTSTFRNEAGSISLSQSSACQKIDNISWLRFQLYFIRNWAEILTCTDLRIIQHLQLVLIQNARGETIRQLFQMSRTAYRDIVGICICEKAQKTQMKKFTQAFIYGKAMQIYLQIFFAGPFVISKEK